MKTQQYILDDIKTRKEELLLVIESITGSTLSRVNEDRILQDVDEIVKEAITYALEQAAEKGLIKTEYYSDEDYGRDKLRDILNEAPIASERTDGDGVLYGVDTYEISKQSILNLKDEIYKEMGL